MKIRLQQWRSTCIGFSQEIILDDCMLLPSQRSHLLHEIAGEMTDAEWQEVMRDIDRAAGKPDIESLLSEAIDLIRDLGNEKPETKVNLARFSVLGRLQEYIDRWV